MTDYPNINHQAFLFEDLRNICNESPTDIKSYADNEMFY